MNAKANVVEEGIEAVTPRTIKLAASIADKPAQWIVNFLLVVSAGFIGWAVTVMPDKMAANTQVVRDDFSAILKTARDDFSVMLKRSEDSAKERLTMVIEHAEKTNKTNLEHSEKASKAHIEHTKEVVSVLRELKDKLDRGPRIKTDGGAQ